MWRAIFLSFGLSLVILGVECLGVEKISMKYRQDPPPANSPFDTEVKVGPRKTFTPPGWAPWSLISSGAVVCLYSFTIPLRVRGK